ncbi:MULTISPECIES: DUF1648 domain-containing protein [Tsukamurella]|uniref:DUF1648 domain-containing protein n=2 Tax=Tsukamurella TaxID=2060 RepID=A0A5C5RY09_9ACTN|nr:MULTISPECIES: DUF1648 domain-containing protein [Tsukamurella]NMD56349.1 DUF1648 domain-containing protein [Tsukamurella columbiensis]TWS26901.1 DUF1648 domain-containing protein [Tsukamurella conjunctivitidis]
MRPRWWIFLAAVVLCGASLAWAAASGPDPFPTHWGGGGTPDAWRPRGSALAILAASTAGLAALFGVLAACTSAIPDGLINLPPTARAYWLDPEHRSGLDALLQRYLLTVGSAVLLLLAVSVTGAIVSPDGNPVLGVGIWVVLAVIAVSTAHLLWRALRPPTDTLSP